MPNTCTQTVEELESRTYFALAYTSRLRASLQPSLPSFWSLFRIIRMLNDVQKDLNHLSSLKDCDQASLRIMVAKLEDLHNSLNQLLTKADRVSITKKPVLSHCFSRIEFCNEAIGAWLENCRFSTDKNFQSGNLEQQLSAYIHRIAGSEDDLNPALEAASIESWLQSDDESKTE